MDTFFLFWFAAIASLGYEKVCVLFNIAALQSAVAATQSIESDDSLKLAAKLLQVSRFIFHLSTNSNVSKSILNFSLF